MMAGLNDMRKERKIAWIYPSENPVRCPVRLTKKYLSLCPPLYLKKNFYLKALTKTKPSQWYAKQVVGQNTLGKVVKQMMKEAEIEGFFTNHSLRRTGSTRLFQAGIDRKLIKEATGHTSDAVDAYQVISDKQREEMSRIIAMKPVESSQNVTIVRASDAKNAKTDEVNVTMDDGSRVSCDCCGKGHSNVTSVIDQIMSNVSKKGKSVIKINIEIHNE